MNIKLNTNQIREIKIGESIYPEKLSHIYSPPKTIYLLGNEKILNQPSISIIGCRQCSEYGKKVSKYFSTEFAKRGINVISGMARGIDTCAHQGVVSTIKTSQYMMNNKRQNYILKSSRNILKDKEEQIYNKTSNKIAKQTSRQAITSLGNTIAVLGCGLDIIYPPENYELYKEIVKNGGAIITEYPLGTMPLKEHFPARNRIISGLSDGVLVIEARERSGTLITVEHALEQGKDVYAVPGNIYSSQSCGTNELIKQGAIPVTSIDDFDILENFKNF